MFHVGQGVECVDDRIAKVLTGDPCKRGAVYTVTDIRVVWCPRLKCKREALRLKELSHRAGYWADRFRPLQDSKLEVFRALLVNLPAPPVFKPERVS